MAEVDDGIRAKTGVVATLQELSDGRLRLTFDDVRTNSPVRPSEWRPTVLYTFTHLNAAQLAEMSFSDKELSDIGFNLMVRLAALANSDA